MNYRPDIHHRRSIRLKEYDYTREGMYYITICTQNREMRLGLIDNGHMKVSAVGKLVETWWYKLPEKFPTIRLDEFIVMPNHIHGIIEIVRVDPRVHPENACQQTVGEDRRVCPENVGTDRPARGQTHGFAPTRNHLDDGGQIKQGTYTGAPLQKIVQWLKTMTTNEYIQHVRNDGWEFFSREIMAT